VVSAKVTTRIRWKPERVTKQRSPQHAMPMRTYCELFSWTRVHIVISSRHARDHGASTAHTMSEHDLVQCMCLT
jgi:hypothetical protein